VNIQVRRAAKRNFANVKFIALVDGEILGNGETRDSARIDAMRALLNGYRERTYPAGDLIWINGTARHKALLQVSHG